ncbi:MAG TPA: GH3 auxin-responsive promoter family protein [Luteibaculaceae bacterium]|nr:GH3 auxin-responsive promoter family protein [Luteibaculaceae bacterium]
MALNAVLSWFIKKRIHQIDLFRKYPSEVQLDVFQHLVQKSKDTEWGLKYGYADIKSTKAFQRQVPLQHYEDIQPYVDRLIAGEQNLLWPTDIKWFAKSSGTTSHKSKFIPVSREALEDCHYKGGKDLLSLFYNHCEGANLYDGKSLVVGGSSQINHLNADSYFGDLSAIIVKNLPFWVEYRRTPDISVALMSVWEEKIEAMARLTAQENVTNMAGVPSWTLVLLRKILEITGASTIAEVWPNLQLFMHGGVSFEPYRDQFKSIIGKPISYLESYNASEGFFGIQDRMGSPEMLLMLDYGIFFEFIPLSELDSQNPVVLTLDEVELNQNYALVISTNAGLWRYIIGDTLKFTQLKPYRFTITGRTKSFINVFGEELMVHNTDKAIAEVCREHRSSVSEYTVGPVFMGLEAQGAHQWLIEFDQEPNNVEAFMVDLDQALMRLNSDYEAKRASNLNLRFPEYRILPKGTFYSWLKEKGKLGGQHKVPRLSNTRVYVDELLQFSEEVGQQR